MRKEKMEIERYIFNKNDTEYYVYVSENKEEKNIYLGKKDYGIVEFEIGFLKGDDLDIEKYIEIYIDKWIGDFENSCEKWDSIE